MRVILVNKTILVSAVALAVSGNAMAAEMYGNMRLGIESTNELRVQSGKLVLGAKGSTDLDSGMTFSYQLEMEHDQADNQQTGWKNDRSWVGIAGGFGKLIAGRHGDMAGWACGGTDLLTIGSNETCSLGSNSEPDNAIQYRISTGAFDFGAAYTADADDADLTSNNTLVGARFSGESWSIGAQIAAMDDNEGSLGVGGEIGTDVFGSGTIAPGDSATQIGGTLQLGNIGLGLVYADNGSTGTTEVTGVGFGFYMPVGPGNIAIVYDVLDGDALPDGRLIGEDDTFYDIEYSQQLGGGAYWGATYNDSDAQSDGKFSLWMGTNF